MLDHRFRSIPKRVVMLGTFGFRPKGTMTARALGLARALQEIGVSSKIVTVPWDNPTEAGSRTWHGDVESVSTRRFNPRLWPLAVREMVQEARAFKPNMIHLFKPKGFGDLAARALSGSGLPVVVDMDDWEGAGGWNDVLPYGRLQRKVFNWQERSWPSRAGALTVASHALRERAIELGASPRRTFYIPNGIPSERFDLLSDFAGSDRTRDPELEGPGPRILLYTRFTEFDPAFAIDILKRVVTRIPDARLVIAGGSADGQAESRLLTSARAAGLSGSLDVLGWIDPDGLGVLARQCDVAIVPFQDSVLNRSKCSVKLVELMACGIPIVASGVGENRAFLDGGRLGELARPGDAEDHASRLISLMESPLLGAELGKRARLAVQARYLWPSLALRALDCYSVALGDSR